MKIPLEGLLFFNIRILFFFKLTFSNLGAYTINEFHLVVFRARLLNLLAGISSVYT